MTIPKAVRQRLGLRPGSELHFEAVEGRLVAEKREPMDVIRKWRGRGRLPGGVGVDAYLKRARDDGES